MTKTVCKGRPTSHEQRALMREQARAGKTRKQIAAFMSCSTETVRRALVNKYGDDLDEDEDYLLGIKGGLALIGDDATTPEPVGDKDKVKEQREEPDILSVSNWSPTPVDPNDLPYVGNDDEEDELDQGEGSADEDVPAALRQSARLRGFKAEDHALPADRKRGRAALSDHDESIADDAEDDTMSRSNKKRALQSDEGGSLGRDESQGPSTSGPSSLARRTRKPLEKAKAVLFDFGEMRRTIEQGRASGIPAKESAAASTSRSTNAAASSSGSNSRTAVAPAQAPRNPNSGNAPVAARAQIAPNNKALSRDAAVKILRDLDLDEKHADIVVATGIKSAEHLKGMWDLPEKLLRLIMTDVREQGFFTWNFIELLLALWQRRD